MSHIYVIGYPGMHDHRSTNNDAGDLQEILGYRTTDRHGRSIERRPEEHSRICKPVVQRLKILGGFASAGVVGEGYEF